MDKRFLYVDYETRNIEGKEFVIIYLLEYNKRQIFKIYRLKDIELIKKLDGFKFATDITDLIDFVIKRDGKISLNIKL